MSHIICDSREIVLIQQSKGELTFVRPLPKQPSEGYTLDSYGVSNKIVFLNKNLKSILVFYDKQRENGKVVHIKLPFAPGQVFRVKEVWRVRRTGELGALLIQYKSDDTKRRIKVSEELFKKYFYPFTFSFEGIQDGKESKPSSPGRWRSGATMPPDFSRYTLTVGEIEVKRVQELSYSEITDIGIDFISRFPSPISIKEVLDNLVNKIAQDAFKDHWNARYAKPRKRGDHYECWPYKITDIYHGITKDSRYDFHGKGTNTWKGLPLTIHSNCYVELFKLVRKEGE